jgi:hypothetical protein
MWSFKKKLDEKCKKCSALNNYHHPRCPNISHKQAKEELIRYYDLWLKKEEIKQEDYEQRQKTYLRLRKEATFWQGKYSIVKNENNILRKKVNY